MSQIVSVLFGILLFCVLIFVHELGHFVAAKASGVQVNEFSMFMGPAIFKKQVGETLYSLRCIPLGGYCAMEGEDEDTDNPRSFQKAAWWKRLIILVAGAAMNFVFGFLLFVVIAIPGDQMVVPIVNQVKDCYVQVDGNGLMAGDRIVKVNGEKIYVSSDINMLVNLHGGTTHDFEVERNGQKLLLKDVTVHEHRNSEGKVTDRHFGFTMMRKDMNFGDKMGYAWNMTIDNVRNVRLSLAMLLTGRAGLKDMMGPVGIVGAMTDVATSAPTWLDALMDMLYFGAFLAVNLGVMNLLPIPALDGGRVVGLLLTTGVEKLTKKKIDPKYEGYIHGIGMILLLALMAVIMFKDVLFIFKG